LLAVRDWVVRHDKECSPCRYAAGDQKGALPNHSFVVLLKGVYGPVVHGPNLGLSTVDLNDGSYSTTLIYPVSGIPGNQNQNKAVGRFYVQFEGDLCAYHIPGGSFSMRFTGSDYVFVDDGAGGQFLDGTFELTVLQATGCIDPSSVVTTTWSTDCTSWPLARSMSTASASSAVRERRDA
jgi:hypothetical protein